MLESFQTTKKERQKLPLILRAIGINHKQENIYRPNGIAFHQWFYCTKGQGELVVNGSRGIITPGTAFFIRSGDAHSYQGIDSDWTLQFFGFEGSICPTLLKTLGMSESGVFHMSDPDSFFTRLQGLYQATTRTISYEKYYYSELLYSLLVHLSLQISRISIHASGQDSQTIRSVISYLEENYANNISLTDLSEALGKTPEYLCTIFKQHLHLTIIGELTDIRISHARVMLVEYPEKSVAEIGFLCGFQSPSYFGKVFKKKCGVTPNEYRIRKL